MSEPPSPFNTSVDMFGKRVPRGVRSSPDWLPAGERPHKSDEPVKYPSEDDYAWHEYEKNLFREPMNAYAAEVYKNPAAINWIFGPPGRNTGISSLSQREQRMWIKKARERLIELLKSGWKPPVEQEIKYSRFDGQPIQINDYGDDPNFSDIMRAYRHNQIELWDEAERQGELSRSRRSWPFKGKAPIPRRQREKGAGKESPPVAQDDAKLRADLAAQVGEPSIKRLLMANLITRGQVTRALEIQRSQREAGLSKTDSVLDILIGRGALSDSVMAWLKRGRAAGPAIEPRKQPWPFAGKAPIPRKKVSEDLDPDAIADLLSEEIRTNNGFLIESEYGPIPGVKLVLNEKESQEIGYSDVNGGMMSYVIFSFEIDIHGRKQSGEIKIYLLNDEYNGHEDPSVRLDEEQMDYLLEALEDELEGESL